MGIFHLGLCTASSRVEKLCAEEVEIYQQTLGCMSAKY